MEYKEKGHQVGFFHALLNILKHFLLSTVFGLKYARAFWHSASYNTGLFFTRSVWNLIKDCSNVSTPY
jgi:hypothetical protein